MILTTSVFFSAGGALGGALKELADANNKFYRDLRDLGPNPKPSQVRQIRKRDFGPALASLYREHSSKLPDWSKAFNANMTRAELSAILGPALSGKLADDGMTKSMAKPAPGAARPVGRIGAQATTGEQGGAEGARDVKYGGKRQQATPQVDADGIITTQ